MGMKAMCTGTIVPEMQAMSEIMKMSKIFLSFTKAAIFLQVTEAMPVLFIATAKVPRRKYARAVSELPPMPPIKMPMVAGIDIPAAIPPAIAARRRATTMFMLKRQRPIITATETTTGLVINI